ncbi:hypothetical protein SDC9_82809 [bioreactor metagenome]|uniref:Uncharacterized protein n=1 Tax=bioreactor metagenome TaxID=1076179 RepID=A0A644ZEA4_9ZZZZ
MPLHIVHLGIRAHVEGMDAVVLRLLAARVMDTAAGYDIHITVRSDIKIVVDHLGEAGFGDDDGDMDRFLFSARLNMDVDT